MAATGHEDGRTTHREPTGEVVLVDSVSFLRATDRGAVVVSASHGGSSAGLHAKTVGPGLIGFNDAGGGKDDAGIAGLSLLDADGVAAFAVGHQTARIGDAADHWEAGTVTAVNSTASEAGLRPGMSVQDAVRHWWHSNAD
jgi:hypothetical protein